MATVGEAFLMVLPNTTGFGAALIMGTEGAAAKAGAAASTAFGKAMSSLAPAGGALLTVAVVGSLVAATNAAGDFEASMVKLVSTAGETGTMVSGNLKLVSNGILALASSTGTTTKQLAEGMYLVESAGFHGAQALTVLQASAQGARAEQANLATVTNAVTSALKSYNLGSDSAVMITNQMVAAVGHGKTTFEEFSGSLATVLPLASSLKISFAEVSGAVATMTNHGTSAAEATQQLAFTMRALVGPNKIAIAEMDRMGVSSVDVAQHIGERGLTGTLKLLSEAVLQHMGPSGLVMIDALNKSATAAEDAKAMIAAMPPTLQKMAQGFLDGTVTIDKWKLGIKGLPADQAAMVKQFAALITHTTGFNDLLKKGGPAAQTYEDAIKKMTGGANGLMTTLMLTGGNLDSFQSNVAAVAEAGKHAGTNIEGWSAITETFNFKVSQFKGTMEALGISIGQKVLPVLGSMVTGLNSMVNWLKGGSTGADLLVKSLGGLVAIIVTLTVVSKVAAAVTALMSSALAVYRTIVFLVTNATELWTAIQLALDAAEMANPIGIIIIAIAALVAGVIYAYTHFKTFRDVVQAVWTAIKVATVSVVNFFTKQVPEAWSFLYEHTIKIFQAVRNAIVGAFNAVIGAVTAAWHFIVDPLVAAWNLIARVTTAVWNGITAFFAKWWPLLLVIFAFPIAALLAIWNHFHTQITAVATAVWNGIKDFLGWIWGGIKTDAALVWEIIRVLIIGPVEWLWARIKQVWGLIKTGLDIDWHYISAAARVIWEAIKGAIINPIESAWHTITTAAANIRAAIIGAFDSAWQAVSNIGEKFSSIGHNIVMGIVHGIANAAGWLYDQIKNLLNNALAAAKSFLGISSPSKVFALQVGHQITAGIAQGINHYGTLPTPSIAAVTGGAVAFDGGTGTFPGADSTANLLDRLDRVLAALRELLDAVNRVAPGVGSEINGSVATMRVLARTS